MDFNPLDSSYLLEGDLDTLQEEIEDLKKKIATLTEGADPRPLQRLDAPPTKYKQGSIRSRRHLRGHYNKILSVAWSSNSTNLVSASQDGKLIIWNGMTTNKLGAITLNSAWVMTCAYSPSGRFVASGGLDNLVTVHKVEGLTREVASRRRMRAELAHHECFVASTKFISDDEVLTASGDSTCMLWDVETQTPKMQFVGHDAGVMSVCVAGSTNTLLSGSCDSTCKLWDLRASEAVMTFGGHDSDVNSVDFFPDGRGHTFVTGSDDSTCRIFDARAFAQVNKLEDDHILAGITSVSFAKNGGSLFAADDSGVCRLWDTQAGVQLQQLAGHDDRVSCVQVSPDGKAVCTASWDNTLRVWA
jgi:guanine nucleotide-binding protein G(I)/G(S)/G(T) subunit beta-1